MNPPSDDDDRTVIRPVQTQSHGALRTGTELAEFVVVRVIGEGGFGIVYEALDRTLERHVALKEFMPSSLASRSVDGRITVKAERHRQTFETALRSFVNEARLLAHFDHPSLVKVHRFWEANGTAYMAMPLYQGVTLQETLRQAPTAPSEALLMALLEPLTDALLVLHGQQCYHRDIAPDNILLLAGSGQPLLLDFGAARRVIGDMTHALTVILKPGYAPIEQYAETPGLKQGPWTDVYALAAVVYYAITGRIPPPAVGRLIDDQYLPATQAAAGRYNLHLLQAIDRALAVQPTARTQSIAEFRAQLGFAPTTARQDSGWSQFADSAADPDVPEFVSSSRIDARSVVPPPAPRAPSHGLAIAAAVLGVAAAGIGLAWFLSREPSLPTVAPPQQSAATAAPAPVAEPASTVPTVSQPPPAAAQETPFDRIVSLQSSSLKVEASPAKRQLRINRDFLSFSVTAAHDGFVHVLLQEPDGTVLLLFPNAISSRNRIAAGKPITLPQASWPLQALEPPGQQRFLVVVTQHAHDFSPLRVGRKGDFTELDRALAAPRGGSFPSISSELPGRASCTGAACNAYGAATFEVETVW